MSAQLRINYDSRTVGVPYVRASRLDIYYPPPNSTDTPRADIHQVWAVKLADQQIATLRQAETLQPNLDLASPAMIPLVDPDSGEPLSPAVAQQIGALIASGNVTMQAAMLIVLAVVRSLQPQGE
jgi:hypothetical protein